MAVGDGATGIVSPRSVEPWLGVERTAAWIRRLADELDVMIVVIGLPTDADGNETPACRRSRALADALERSGIAVALQPELLTTDEARRRARAVGRRRAAPVDDLAAQVILEEYLSTSERADD